MFEFFDSIDTSELSFRTSKEYMQDVRKFWLDDSNLFEQIQIGQSEEGRPIYAFAMGRGEKHVALLAGAHSDEPVGPEMLRLLIKHFIMNEKATRSLLQEYTFVITPHINPDGEIQNQPWITNWPDMAAYAAHAFREQPGQDLEFGYPDMRPENRAVADLFRQYAPFELYINFHGMAFSEGIMLLIERHWITKTGQLRQDFCALADTYGLTLHDHDRKSEKGFKYIDPGFTTTPEGRAMQHYFKDKGDEKTASKFHLSSMEYIRSLGGDPLCLVTELPLYMVSLKEEGNEEPGVPQVYLEFKKILPKIRKYAINDEPIKPMLSRFEINPLPLQDAVQIQLSVLKSALRLIRGKRSL